MKEKEKMDDFDKILWESSNVSFASTTKSNIALFSYDF